MRDYGIVLETLERTVFHADSGLYLKSLMEAIIYRKDRTPVLVLTRRILTPNATNAIGSYTVISGTTLEEWKRNMEESTLMLWKPLPSNESGLEMS